MSEKSISAWIGADHGGYDLKAEGSEGLCGVCGEVSVFFV